MNGIGKVAFSCDSNILCLINKKERRNGNINPTLSW